MYVVFSSLKFNFMYNTITYITIKLDLLNSVI